MNTIETVERDFKEKVCDKLKLTSEGVKFSHPSCSRMVIIF
jgi:hypothetical protein